MAAKRHRCPRCLIGGYEQSYTTQYLPGRNRPRFTCTNCGHGWSEGITGGQSLLRPVTGEERASAGETEEMFA